MSCEVSQRMEKMSIVVDSRARVSSSDILQTISETQSERELKSQAFSSN